jgi:hypothetical protein
VYVKSTRVDLRLRESMNVCGDLYFDVYSEKNRRLFIMGSEVSPAHCRDYNMVSINILNSEPVRVWCADRDRR